MASPKRIAKAKAYLANGDLSNQSITYLQTIAVGLKLYRYRSNTLLNASKAAILRKIENLASGDA